MAPVELYFCSPGYRGCLPIIPSYLLLFSHPSGVLWHLTMRWRERLLQKVEEASPWGGA